MDANLRKRQPERAARKRSAPEEKPKKTKKPRKAVQRSAQATAALYNATTNPSEVDQPVVDHVHENLSKAWKINRSHPMCFVFDLVNPARRFARGMPYDDRLEFPDADRDQGNVTETDVDDGIGLMPIRPAQVKYAVHL